MFNRTLLHITSKIFPLHDGGNPQLNLTSILFLLSSGEKILEYSPLANEVWGKVMFLHLSVSHSVHGGQVSAPLHAGIHTPPRQTAP